MILKISILVLLIGHLSAQQATVCNSNECSLGTCEITSPSTYSCHCNAGVTGQNCNQQATAAGNPCASNPCYGGGTCLVISSTQFACQCPPGRAGTLCKGYSGSCQCVNNGVCSQLSTSGPAVYECGCPSGFGGHLCQYQLAAANCQFTGCANGGTCTILNTCKCPPNFTGPTCSTPSAPLATTLSPSATPGSISICAPGICKNGGECFQLTTNLGICLCPQGWTGLFCTIASSPGGPGAPTTVLPPLTGLPGVPTTLPPFITFPSVTQPNTPPTTPLPLATTLIPPAATTPVAYLLGCGSLTNQANFNPCQNNGTCLADNSTGTFQCRCKPSFNGIFCENRVAFCSTNPCLNGGTCSQSATDTFSGSCACASGFSGPQCEISTTCKNNPCLNNQRCQEIFGVARCFCTTPYKPPYCSL